MIGAPNPDVGDDSSPAGYAWNAVSALIINDGHNDNIANNVIDLGSSGKEAVANINDDGLATNGLGDNSITNNVILSINTSPQQTESSDQTGLSYYSNEPAGDFTIANNDYFNTGGGPVNTSGQTSNDSNPVFENPEVSGQTDQLASNSPVTSGPVGLAPIAGNFGPPGFVVPDSASASSDS